MCSVKKSTSEEEEKTCKSNTISVKTLVKIAIWMTFTTSFHTIVF